VENLLVGILKAPKVLGPTLCSRSKCYTDLSVGILEPSYYPGITPAMVGQGRLTKARKAQPIPHQQTFKRQSTKPCCWDQRTQKSPGD